MKAIAECWQHSAIFLCELWINQRCLCSHPKPYQKNIGFILCSKYPKYVKVVKIPRRKQLFKKDWYFIIF